MTVQTADCPTASDLDQLTGLLRAEPLDRGALDSALRRIEVELSDRGIDLDRSGGLLDEADKVARPSLAREDSRLRDELTELARNVRAWRELARTGTDDEVRQRGAPILAGLRGHRDAEAGLVLESADTEVGAGD